MSAAKLFILSLVPAAFASAVSDLIHHGNIANMTQIPASPLTPRATAMQLSDRFAISGLDRSEWVEKMIAEGKLVEPAHNNTASFRAAAGLFDLNNIVCGVLVS